MRQKGRESTTVRLAVPASRSTAIPQLNRAAERFFHHGLELDVSEDEWLRRRIRMCYWKQWRWVCTKIKHLLALGLSLKTAIQHGVSSKSYWHMARTPAVQQAVSNAWLKAQGLVSVKELWCTAQGYTG
jgi:hypothetical protein